MRGETHRSGAEASATLPIQEVSDDAVTYAINESLGQDLNTAFGAPESSAVPSQDQSFQDLCDQVETTSQPSTPPLRPFGSLSAKIGFLVDGVSGTKISDEQIGDDSSLRLPWGISESGFTEDNVLVATYNF